MELKIIEKKENTLLGRTEVLGSLSFEGATPSNLQLVESLAKEFKTDASRVVMKHINTKFSLQKADFTGFVYDDASSKSKAERLTKHIKKKMEEARKKAEEERKAKEEEKAAEEAKKAEEAAKAAAEKAAAEEKKEETHHAEESAEGEKKGETPSEEEDKE